MAKRFNTEQVLSTLTRQQCCLLEIYKLDAKRKKESEEIMRKIKPLL